MPGSACRASKASGSAPLCWSDDGVAGANRFLKRLWSFAADFAAWRGDLVAARNDGGDLFDAALLLVVFAVEAGLLFLWGGGATTVSGVAAGLLGHTDQHVARRAELLELNLAETEAAQRRTHLGEIGRTRLLLHLHQRAADEVDTEVQAVREIEHHRHDRQQRRHGEADAPEAHEVELGVVRDDAKEAHTGD